MHVFNRSDNSDYPIIIENYYVICSTIVKL